MTKCTACGHENDLTRVFCQNCGTRLERDAGVSVPQVSEPGTPPPLVETANRPAFRKKAPQSSLNQPKQKSLAGMFVKKVISTAILGAILAVIVLIARPPVTIPAPSPVNEMAANNLLQFVEDYSESPYLRELVLTEQQINGYLASKVKVAASTAGALYKPEFKRAFVVINQGSLRVFIEQSLAGYSLYEYMDVVPKVSKTGLTYETTGAGIGRFPMPEQGIFLLEDGFSALFGALRDLQSPFATAHELILTPGSVKIRWLGQKPPGR